MEYFMLLWTLSTSVPQTVSVTLTCDAFAVLCSVGVWLWKYQTLTENLLIRKCCLSVETRKFFNCFPVVLSTWGNFDLLISFSDYHLLFQWRFHWNEEWMNLWSFMFALSSSVLPYWNKPTTWRNRNIRQMSLRPQFFCLWFSLVLLLQNSCWNSISKSPQETNGFTQSVIFL